jgi:glycine/D-amino acid oxidase-like deaminating enzyme/nitrite reductase/ring-hydroxylating ferredoxin subunit
LKIEQFMASVRDLPKPYWTAADRPRSFPALDRNLTVDVAIVGGGITGITTAYLLKQAGLSVALLERGRCTQGETAHTTAHLAAVTDRRFTDLTRTLGRDHAQAVWDAGFAAIAEIDDIVRREQIDCDFRWVPAFLHVGLDTADAEAEARTLREDAAAIVETGFDCEYLESVPVMARPGIRFDGQAKFHPLKYADALLDRIGGDGSHVFEESPVDEVEDDPLRVTARGHEVSAGYVVIATHMPIVGKSGFVGATLLQTDLYGYSTYAIAATVPAGRLPEALFWDSGDPYYYLRVDPHGTHDVVIFGGSDHKTGQADDTRDHFDRVRAQLVKLVPEARVTHRWSGQVIETRDGLPYIGETAARQFTATGFSGNGITFATVSALMARDAATGRVSPWRDLFDARRTRVAAGLWDYLTENKDYPYYLIRDRFAGARGKSLRALRRGEGKILEINGKRVAAHRASDGAATLLSPYCTHLGCLVDWNQAGETWDCPCHGSRFEATGEVIGGPAETPLRPVEDGTDG